MWDLMSISETSWLTGGLLLAILSLSWGLTRLKRGSIPLVIASIGVAVGVGIAMMSLPTSESADSLAVQQWASDIAAAVSVSERDNALFVLPEVPAALRDATWGHAATLSAVVVPYCAGALRFCEDIPVPSLGMVLPEVGFLEVRLRFGEIDRNVQSMLYDIQHLTSVSAAYTLITSVSQGAEDRPYLTIRIPLGRMAR